MFDPYRKWLGIPEESRPPTHYQLLGLAPNEQDPEVINAAVVRQSAYVRNFQAGKFAEHATRLLNEISAARACLLDAAKRAEYDAQLQRAQAKTQPPPTQQQPAKTRTQPIKQPTGSRPAARPPANARPPAKPARPASARGPRNAPASGITAPLVDPLLEQLAASPSPLGGQRSPYRLVQQARRPLAAWQIVVGIGAGALMMLGVVLLLTMGGDGDQLDLVNQPTVASASDGSSGSSASGDVNPLAGNSNTSNSSPSTSASTSSSDSVPFKPRPGPSSTGNSSAGNTSAGNSTDVGSSDDSTSPSNNGASPRVARVEATWGDSTQLGIPAPEGDTEIVFASRSGPYVAIGVEIFNLKTGNSAGKVDTEPERRQLCALAPDGKHMALSRSDLRGAVELYDCKSGRMVHELRIKGRNPSLEFVDFSDEGHLVTAFREFSDSLCQVWDIESGKLRYELPTERFDSKDASISPDGKFLAIATNSDGVLVYELKKRKLAARLMPPKDKGSAFLMCKGLAFSADSQEIVAVADFGNRLLGWSGDAKVIFDYRSDVNLQSSWAGAFSYGGRAVDPVPDGSGWLLNGHLLFERSSRRVVWMFKSRGGSEDRFHFLDADHLIVTQGGNRNRTLTRLKIPRKEINDSVAAMNAGKEAYLSPRQLVGLQVNVGQLRTGTAQQVSVELERVLTDRLKAAGLQVGSGAPSVFVVGYSESVTTVQRLMTDSFGRPIFDVNRRPSFQQLQSTRGDLQLSLVPLGQSDAIWNAETSATGDSPIPGSRSGSIYDSLAEQLKGVPIPFFIPKDDGLPSLPVVSEL